MNMFSFNLQASDVGEACGLVLTTVLKIRVASERDVFLKVFKVYAHLHLMRRLQMHEAIPPVPQFCTAWYLVKFKVYCEVKIDNIYK